MTHFGHVILIVAFSVIFFSAVAAFAGVHTGSRRLMNGAKYGAIVTAGLYTLALAIILYAFVTKDFNLKIVADHASSDLPFVYSLSALYADKAGSLFLWGWLVSLFTVFLSLQRRSIADQRVLSYAIFVLGIIQLFFLALVAFAANVFERNLSTLNDGFGLNPLLQNLGMLIHPPLLYIGFSGFAIVFALAIALVIVQGPISLWTGIVKKWAIFAWCMLGIGNILGMWWSYNELGWGGYWAWDPVENAGLMPWLLSTAFLHMLIISKQRNHPYIWNYILIVMTFAFTLLSPFITHGGIESPLHGFYGSNFPPYILAAILISLLCSLLLLGIRRDYFKSGKASFPFISRKSALLTTNVIILILVAVILLGTVLPKVVELITGAKIAIDRTFFDRTCGPLLLALVLFMGVCTLLGWGKSLWHRIKRIFLYSILITLIITAIILIINPVSWYNAVIVGLAFFPLVTILFEWLRGTIARHRNRKENYLKAFLKLPYNNPSRYGGLLVHIGVVMISLGVIASSFYGNEGTATLDLGESMKVGKYEFVYEELLMKQDSRKVSAVASISVIKDDRLVTSLKPSYDYWFRHKNSFAEVAVRSTPSEDIFVSLVWTAYDPHDNEATFRVLVNPLIIWIWVGGGFFLLGGALAFSANRKKQTSEE